MRKLITFLLVAATVALSLLTAIMMFSATDIFPLPSDFQESAASIISRIAAVLAEAVLVSGLCVATHFLIKKKKFLFSRTEFCSPYGCFSPACASLSYASYIKWISD